MLIVSVDLPKNIQEAFPTILTRTQSRLFPKCVCLCTTIESVCALLTQVKERLFKAFLKFLDLGDPPRQDVREKVHNHLEVQDHRPPFLEIVGPLLVFESTEQVAQKGDQDVEQHDGHHYRSKNNRDSRKIIHSEIVLFDAPEEGDEVRLGKTLPDGGFRVEFHHQQTGHAEEVRQDQEENHQSLDDGVDHSDQKRERLEDPQEGKRPVEHKQESSAAQDVTSLCTLRSILVGGVELEEGDRQDDQTRPVDVVPGVAKVSSFSKQQQRLTSRT